MKAGDVISYREMCWAEEMMLIKGINFPKGNGDIVILMNKKEDAPYEDQEENGNVIVYEGHDVKFSSQKPHPKVLDQPMFNKNGSLTDNGKLYREAEKYRLGYGPARMVKIYEKIQPGQWLFKGRYKLIDAFIRRVGNRKVFKFILVPGED